MKHQLYVLKRNALKNSDGFKGAKKGYYFIDGRDMKDKDGSDGDDSRKNLINATVFTKSELNAQLAYWRNDFPKTLATWDVVKISIKEM